MVSLHARMASNDEDVACEALGRREMFRGFLVFTYRIGGVK